MAKKNIEVSLVSVNLVSTGTKRKESRHALTATLVWPRPTIARKESAFPCTLEKGAADYSGSPWHETILFKETVEGTFGLRMELSESLSDDAIASFMRTFEGLFLQDVGTMLGKTNLVLGDVLANVFTAAYKKSGTAPPPALVASGGVTLEPADLRDGMTVEIPLMAPVSLTETKVSGSAADRGTERTTKVLLRKGAANGSVTVRIALV